MKNFWSTFFTILFVIGVIYLQNKDDFDKKFGNKNSEKVVVSDTDEKEPTQLDFTSNRNPAEYQSPNTVEHDFFVAVFMNPDNDYQDFRIAGMTPNNTAFQSAETYWSTRKVKEFFKNESTFQIFYNNVKIAHNYFKSDNTERRHLVEYEYSSMDILTPENALRGNVYQRNFCFANRPDKLHYLTPIPKGDSYGELEDKIDELEQKVQVLEK